MPQMLMLMIVLIYLLFMVMNYFIYQASGKSRDSVSES